MSPAASDDEDDRPAGGKSAADATNEGISLSQIFDVLQNERRRIVIRYLADCDDPVEFTDLVDHVAATAADVERIDSTIRKAAYTSLYQSHLPKLEDLGVVTYDQNAGTVGAGEHLSEVVDCLETVERMRGMNDAESKGPLQSLRSVLGL